MFKEFNGQMIRFKPCKGCKTFIGNWDRMKVEENGNEHTRKRCSELVDEEQRKVFSSNFNANRVWHEI